MKIKNILSAALLFSMLTIGVASAAGPDLPAGDPAKTGDEAPKTTTVVKQEDCFTNGEAFFIDTTTTPNVTKCMEGVAFCNQTYGKTDKNDDAELAWDKTARSCYLKLKESDIGQFSVLPYTAFSVAQCEEVYEQDATSGGDLFKKFLSGESETAPTMPAEVSKNGQTPKPDEKAPTIQKQVYKRDILGCGIKTGRMKLWMIPYYIKFLIQFALSIAGIIAVGALVVGGYLYMFGSIMDDKEKGKRSIMYGLGGFVVVLLAWAIVNVVISLATM